MSETNITPAHKEAFEALRDPEYPNFALFSCFVNGEPAASICALSYDEETREYRITPLFVSVTPGMTLMDHGGVSPNAE